MCYYPVGHSSLSSLMNVTVLQIHALTSERDCLCAKVSELTAVSLVLSLIASFMLKWLNSFL